MAETTGRAWDCMDRLPVSVIIPTYNRARLILRSLNSVLAAVDPGDEVIVVDDGSTDNTRETLEPYLDRIRYVAEPHRGGDAARNCGIAAARNPPLAFNFRHLRHAGRRRATSSGPLRIEPAPEQDRRLHSPA